MVSPHLFICCGSVIFSRPSSLPDCYLAFSRSWREPGPNRKQPPVAHVCAPETWREIKGIWQALCLIYNIISNISMSQTAPAKQSLMIQTHKTHTGWEWVGFKTEKTNAAFSFVLYTVFPGQRLLERHLGYICLILPLACLQGVMFHSAKLYFSISASRGHWVIGFSALLSYLDSVLHNCVWRWN